MSDDAKGTLRYDLALVLFFIKNKSDLYLYSPVFNQAVSWQARICEGFVA